MNLNKCEQFFGFVNYLPTLTTFVCINIPNEEMKCLGIKVDKNNIPIDNKIYILQLKHNNSQIVEEFWEYNTK